VSTHPELVIVGSGIGGLVLAYRLQSAGLDVVLIEADDTPGGVIRSRDWGGTVVESGPNSFLAGDHLIGLLDELELRDAIVEPEPRYRRRYVVRDGALRVVPMSPPGLLKTDLLGARAKGRILLEPWLHGKPPVEDESVRAFVERHLGGEAYRYLPAPFVNGVWAGDPEQLSVRSAFPELARLEAEHGSLIKAMVRRRSSGAGGGLRSFALRGGNRLLPLELGRRLGDALRLSWPVASVERGNDGWIVRRADGDELVAPWLALAVPPATAATLLAVAQPALASELTGFERAAVAVVHARVNEAALARDLDGFGYQVPRGERFRHLGTIWTSSIYPDRATSGEALLTTFIGGALDPEAASLDDATTCELVDSELRRLGLYAGSPAAIARDPGTKWIAQYTLGHARRLETAEQLAAKAGGLYLAGSGFRGVSVTDCVREAGALAGRILEER